MGQLGLFDLDNRLAKLSKIGDPLETIDKVVNWKAFRPTIQRAFRIDRKSNAGRPRFDYVMMFKILILQTFYNLSDGQAEFQIIDRLSFRRFLGLSEESVIPDEKTIWLFRETLVQAKVVEKLFDLFQDQLNAAGYYAKKGQIVDASFVEVPRQRNTREENEQVKNGQTPDEWEKHPAKLCQKDVDARWVKKNDENFFGYKNHVSVDVKNKLIREYDTTSAEVHDSQVFAGILDPVNTNQTVYADSAYGSEEHDGFLTELQYKNRIHEKATRNKPLTDFQQAQNKKKSSVRARVEHVFAMIEQMHGGVIRCIGRLRAAAKIGLLNLVYNMRRLSYLESHA
jgi:transposase, IS5 family